MSCSAANEVISMDISLTQWANELRLPLRTELFTHSCKFERGKATVCVQLVTHPLLLSSHYSTAQVQQHSKCKGRTLQ